MTYSSLTCTDNAFLLAHLQDSFKDVHNPHDLHLTALVSTPKRTTSLFPYTTQHPRCFQVDYLITLGCEVDEVSAGNDTSAAATASSVGSDGQESVVAAAPGSAKNVEVGSRAGAKEGKKRVLTTALSAHLYILPHHQSSILYISKLDSSGYPTIPLPLTRTFIISVLRFFISPDAGRPSPHVRIQLFARSQGQYLFPNSAEGPKKVLGGLGLCGWWKGVYEEVAATAKAKGQVRLGMVLPGYSADEAKGMLGQRRPLPEGVEWTSTPPFGNSLPASTSSTSSASTSTAASLAHLIPSFPDDPKSRFLDDLVTEGAEDPHRRRKLLGPKGESGSTSSIASTSSASGSRRTDTHRAKLQAEDEAERRFTQATLERVSQDEYWERMGFRQECISGDVTGFFSLESDTPSPPAPSSGSGPGTGTMGDPVPSRTALPPEIVDRLLVALLNTDFKTFTSAIDHTAIWDRAVRSVVVDEIGEEGYQGCIATIMGKGHQAAIPGAGQHGSGLGLAAGQVKRKDEPVVTMLQPRKKKKAA